MEMEGMPTKSKPLEGSGFGADKKPCISFDRKFVKKAEKKHLLEFLWGKGGIQKRFE